tara:strand:+ start:2635 stop:2913 length:279 start_codon:yes stop_codon:yes gene_type:complete
MANLYTHNEEKILVKPKNEKVFELSELQDFVDGYIEKIILPIDNRVMVINTDREVEKLPYNNLATQIYLKNFPEREDYIVGNAVICSKEEIN